MSALHDIVKKGSTDRSVTLRIIDATTGVPDGTIVFNSSGIDLWYRREGAARTAITEATLAALTTAHTDGGFLHISDGDYRLDLPDAAYSTGANHVDFGGTVTGRVVIGGRVRLVDYDPEDVVRLGLTALPNAAAEAAGGLYTRGSGTGQINQPGNGVIDANVVAISGDITAADNLEAAADGTGFNLGGGAVVAASVTAGVTVTTNNDKTGYGLSAGAVQAVWDALTSALTTVGSIGKRIVDNLDAAVSSRLASASYTTPPTVGQIADQVWEETLADHSGTAGSTAAALNAAGSAGDPWNTALPGAYGAGSAGKIIGDNLNATVSSRATPAQVNTEADQALADVGLTTTITGRVDAAVSSRSSHSAADVWTSGTRTLTNGAGIKKNTALAAFMFLMVDDTDGKTPETGLTITAQRSLDGAAFAACANSATEVSNGWYKIDLAAGDVNGDIVVLRFSGTGARTREIVIVTEP